MVNRSTKKSVGIRLTDEAVRLLRDMAADKGLSQAGIIELAVREKAERDGYRSRDGAEATAAK